MPDQKTRPAPYDVEADSLAMFAVDVARHRMTVRLDQGVYRHLVFQQPENSWCARFELITTPGMLTISGDRGTFSFRRLYDMFEFFRSNPDRPHSINVGYWAEKMADNGRSVQVYSEEQTRLQIQDYLDQAIADRDEIQKEYDEENLRQLENWREDLRANGRQEDDPGWPAPEPEKLDGWPELVKARELVEKAKEAIEDADADGKLGWESGARELLSELEQIGLVSDTWEWKLTDWDFHFVCCLNAIAWGIQQYDKAVRDGQHVRRTGPVAEAIALPTTAPAKPKPPAAAEQTETKPIKVLVTMGERL